MKTSNRCRLGYSAQLESLEAVRNRLAAFASATRDMVLRRGKLEEPTMQGPDLYEATKPAHGRLFVVEA